MLQEFPHVTILDPRTGAVEWTYEHGNTKAVDLREKFMERLLDWLGAHPYPQQGGSSNSSSYTHYSSSSSSSSSNQSGSSNEILDLSNGASRDEEETAFELGNNGSSSNANGSGNGHGKESAGRTDGNGGQAVAVRQATHTGEKSNGEIAVNREIPDVTTASASVVTPTGFDLANLPSLPTTTTDTTTDCAAASTSATSAAVATLEIKLKFPPSGQSTPRTAKVGVTPYPSYPYPSPSSSEGEQSNRIASTDRYHWSVC